MRFIKKKYYSWFFREKKKQIINRDFYIFEKLCIEALKTKIFFFIKDEREKNTRLNLNFGHTFAHAIEMALNIANRNELIRHGEAVGLGMLCEIYYASSKKNNLYLRTKNILEQYSLITSLKELLPNFNKMILHKKIFDNIFLDKKKIGAYPRYVSLKSPYSPNIKNIFDMTKLNETIYHIFD